MEFQAFEKIPRLNRDIIITEKIDGTNAAVVIEPGPEGCAPVVGAQSRKRLITPDDDNFGFAKWVSENREALVETLGEGRHFGEWWGSGIQRGYGLEKGEKRFSLFNTKRWDEVNLSAVPGLGVVPVLYQGPFDTFMVPYLLNGLEHNGSVAAPGFMQPEGVVIYHTAGNLLFKATIHNDEMPKGVALAAS